MRVPSAVIACVIAFATVARVAAVAHAQAPAREQPVPPQPPAPAREQQPTPAREQPPAPAREQPPAPAREQQPTPAREQPPAPAREQPPTPAREQQPMRVVVATSDRVLVAALADAFFPAGMVVLQVDDVAPAAIGELAATSRTVAEREGAGAVVWLLVEASSTTLVAYDRAVDRVLVRPLPYVPPLSAARAAETARAARTMLRALKLSDEPDTQPPPVVTVPITVEPPPAPRPWGNFAAYASFGGRYGRLGEDGVAELQIAAAWRPDALGAIVMASLSPQASLSSPSFMGNVSDNSFALAARIPFVIAPRISVAGYAGPALHAVSVDGTLGAESVSALRFDAAFRVGATGGYAVTDRFDVGLAVSMDTLLKRQRYEVMGGQVLVMPRLQVSVGLLISVRVL